MNTIKSGPPTTDSISVAGFAYRVRVTGRSSADDDPLMRAVLELVHVGLRARQQVLAGLDPVHPLLVDGAIDRAILVGRLVEDAGLLSAVALEDSDRTERREGFVFWSPLEHRLLPLVLFVDHIPSDRRPLPGKSEQRPSHWDLRDELHRCVQAGRVQLLRRDSPDGEYEEADGLIDEIALVRDQRPQNVALRCQVSFALSFFERDLAFQRATLSGLEDQAPFWPAGAATFRERPDCQTKLGELRSKMNELREQYLTPHLREGSVAELQDHVERRLGFLRAPDVPDQWRDEDLVASARAALTSERVARLVTDGTERARHLAVARDWAAVLELITRRLGDEAITVLSEPWTTMPTTREAACAMLDELGVDLGSTHGLVIKNWTDKPNALAAMKSTVGQYVPGVDGGRRGRGPRRSGCGELVSLWVLAALANDAGRTGHAERIRRGVGAYANLFHALGELIAWRNDVIHMNPGEPPHPQVIADRTLAIWKALALTTQRHDARLD